MCCGGSSGGQVGGEGRPPGIVTVFECGQVNGTGTSADGVAYIAMELLHGESLSDRLAQSGQLEPDDAMEIMRQVASALEVAHRGGIVHRDLKPDNIFLVTDPAMPRANASRCSTSASRSWRRRRTRA